jgi:hypothetical protein
MHVVLVNPPPGVASGFRPNIDCRPNLLPPSLLSPAAPCEGTGHRTELLDCPILGWGLRDFEGPVEGASPYVGTLADATRRLSPGTTLVAGGSHAISE